METFEKILNEAKKLKATDIHVLGNGEVFFRVHKKIQKTSFVLNDIQGLANEFLSSMQIFVLENSEESRSEIDVSVCVENTRLRINFYSSNSALALCARVLPEKIPSFEELKTPPILSKIFTETKGLILVSGATGSGKSTTIAAGLEYINHNMYKHIICIEDPIEYLHTNDKSFFSYREISKDSKNYDSAIKASLRQDPDIISIGELRDNDSIKSSLLASQMGHLVVGTTHAIDASSSLSRLINSFEHNRSEIASELALSLQAVVSQKLIPIANTQMVAIFEVLIATPAVRALIRDQKFHQLPSQIAMGKEFGMISFEQSLREFKLMQNQD